MHIYDNTKRILKSSSVDNNTDILTHFISEHLTGLTMVFLALTSIMKSALVWGLIFVLQSVLYAID